MILKKSKNREMESTKYRTTKYVNNNYYYNWLVSVHVYYADDWYKDLRH